MIIDTENPAFGAMQNVKARMFALRNGIVADTLRKAGDPHKIIFGLTIVQIKQLAEVSGTDASLADMLWANDTTRESRLMAPFLFDKSKMTLEKALALARDVLCVEEADILCQRLLRGLPFAAEIINALRNDKSDLLRYVALRLVFNLVPQMTDLAENVARAEQERKVSLTYRVASQLIEEVRYLKS